MTELSPVCHASPMTPASQKKLNSCGFLVPNTKAAVVDVSTGRKVQVGEPGELWISGPQVMKGYLGKPEATKETVLESGFLRTGDMATYDTDGYFFIVDRLKELIKVRGFQVAPAELENILLTHPGVSEAAVVGYPDEYSGELPKAFIVTKPGTPISEKDIMELVRGKVARFKEIKYVEFLDELPKNGTGKILRRVLKERASSKIQSKL